MADKTQVHKVELVVKLDDTDVVNWIDKLVDAHNKTLKESIILSTDATPLDIEDRNNKWIKDLLNDYT
jgi:flagellar capping protein FliD|tara:strand:- start:479 stop:682 length:204 start_codon:yes stop_codon:yes gene_type:complete